MPPFPALLANFSFLCQGVFCLCSDNLSQAYPIMPGSDDNSFAAHLRQFALMVSLACGLYFPHFFSVFSRFFFSLDLNGFTSYTKKLPISTVRRPSFTPGLMLTLNRLVCFSTLNSVCHLQIYGYEQSLSFRRVGGYLS